MASDKTAKQISRLLEKKGYQTFAQVDREFNLKTCTASNAARYPVKAGEEAILKVLEMQGKDVWPSRYDATTGKRLSRQPRENYPHLAA